MRFRILGPVEAFDEGERLSLGGAKARLLLAALLTSPGHVLPTERLIDILWGEEPPSTARALIHTYVSTLRRALNRPGTPDVIVTRPPGYLVEVGSQDVDAAEFERLVTEARQAVRSGQHADGASTFRAAEALWHGPAYGGDPSMQAEADRLEELRLAAIEERTAAEIELGREEELVVELASLVGAHPTHERLRARLMVVLYRLGRQADALAVYHKGRDALVELLGIDPGPELTGIHDAILRAEPWLLRRAAEPLPVPAQRLPTAVSAPRPVARVQPAASPAQLPAVPADFTGRCEQIAALVDQISPSREDRPSQVLTTCVIAGKGGVGKSTLALRVGHDLAAEFPDGQLYADLRGATDRPREPVEVLGRFLRALGADPARLAESAEERAETVRTLLAPRRMLVILDDALDERQVRPLLPGGAGNAVIVTSRRRLPGLEGAVHLDLDMLAQGEAVTLLGRIAGEARVAAEVDAAQQVARLCGFLPLAIRIVGARLASHPHWTLESLATRLADETRRLDELAVADQQVRAGIQITYQGIDETARAALRILAVVGLPDFPSYAVASLLDMPAARAEDIVERLVEAQVIDFARVDTLGLPRYRINELIRIYAVERASTEDGPDSVADSVRRLLLGWLWLVQRISDDAPTGAIPLHPDTTRPKPPDAAVAELVLARPHAWLEAEQATLVTAVERAAALNLADISVALATELCGSVFAVGNHFEAWGRTHASALVAARRTGDRAAEATLLAQLGQLRSDQDRYAEAHEYLLESLSIFRELGDDRGEASVLAAIGSTCREQGRLRESVHFLRQAQERFSQIVERGQTRATLDAAAGYIGRLIGSTLLEQGDFARAQFDLTQAARAYRRMRCRRGEALTVRSLSLLHRAMGELDEALELSLKALSIFRSLGDELLEAYAVQSVAKTLVRLGRGEEALGMLDEALATCSRLLDQWGEAFMLRTRGELHLAAGRLDPAEADLTEAIRRWVALDVPLQRARCERDLAAVRDARRDHQAAAALRASAIETFRSCGAREYSELAMLPRPS